MEKLIKLVVSPFNSGIETVEHIVLSVHVPYSEHDVTIQINPNVQDYVENNDQPGIQVRQVMTTTSTDETKTLHFDFGKDNIQKIISNGKEYEIKLIQIGKENLRGEDFPYFEGNFQPR